MYAPRIVAVGQQPDGALTQQAFVVVGAGSFQGQGFRIGELLVCGAEVCSEGDVVILAPVGRGRARLGTVRGGRLYGEAGEPCRRARWQVVGRLERVVAGSGQVRQLQFDPHWREPRPVDAALRPSPRPRAQACGQAVREQLPLFPTEAVAA